MDRLDGTQFDWLTWRADTMVELLGVRCRRADISAQIKVIRRYAIGWCPGEELLCRPKAGCVGIMFLKDGTQFWTHITKEEFDENNLEISIA